jgi:hypothetical protein
VEHVSTQLGWPSKVRIVCKYILVKHINLLVNIMAQNLNYYDGVMKKYDREMCFNYED